MSDPTEPKAPGALIVGVTVGISAQTLLAGQLAWLQSQGWAVTLVTSPDEAAHAASMREKVGFAGIPMARDIAPAKDLKALWLWLRTLRRLRPHAVSIGTPKASLLGLIAAWITSVPKRLYVVRGLRLEGTSGLLEKVLWAMERVSMAAATDVFYISHSLAEEAGRRGLLPVGKSWLIAHGSSNGVNAQEIQRQVSSIDRDEIRSRLGLKPGDFIIGFIGRISPDKGIDTLLEAMQRQPVADTSCRLLLVGVADGASHVDQIASLGDRIVTVPWVDNVTPYLAAIDVLCLPTRREGFGNVVLEAAAAGVPAVTSNATGVQDTVIHGETGFLVDLDDADGFAQRFSQLKSDPTLLKTLGDAARERVVRDFAQESIWRGYDEILRSAADPQFAIRIRGESSFWRILKKPASKQKE